MAGGNGPWGGGNGPEDEDDRKAEGRKSDPRNGDNRRPQGAQIN